MADFDKDLKPIIKPTGYSASDIKIGPGMNFTSGGGGGVSDLSQKEDVFAELEAAGQKFSQKGLFITNAELEANKRYKTFNPTIGDYEDFAAQGQSAYKQAANGVLKGVNLAATTVAGGFGTLYGIGKAIAPGGKFSDIYENEVMTSLDKWNTYIDNEVLPNYYTAAERNAEWYSTDNWFTTNFLFDKLIKNSGYAVGAMVGGNIANAGLLAAGTKLGGLAAKGAAAAEASQAFKLFTPLLRNTARAFSAGKNAEAAALLESQISSIADLSAKSATLSNISKQTATQFAKFSDASRRTAVAAYSSAGEASFEALQSAKELRENLIEEYTRENGYAPTGEDLKNINFESEKVGKTSFYGNMALLAITEYAQLPYLIGSNYDASRQAANTLLGKVYNVAKDETGKYATKAGPKTKFGKLYEGTKRVGAYVFDPKESAQEVLQYGLGVGTQNYFKKAQEGGEADLYVDGVLYGLMGKDKYGEGVGALVSKEGIEGGILGGITGGAMQARGSYLDRKATATNTENFLNMINNAPTFKEAFKDKLAATNRGIVLQQQHRDAIINGDRLEERDLKNDLVHTYLAPRIKYGRFDMVTEDLNELKSAGISEQGLSDLKQQGLANINDTVESFQKRINTLQNSAKDLNNLYQSLNLRYSGETVEVNGEERRKYSPATIDKLAYAGSKIANYDVRIPQLNSKIAGAGINTQAILEGIIETGVPNVEATKEALDIINSMNVTSDVKDELKGTLDDVIELSLRRKMFIDEYDGIKNNPLNYERPEEEVSEIEVSQKEGRKKSKKVLEVGKSYSLAEPIVLEKGKIVLAPKVTVVSSTLGGEYEVQLPDGSSTFFSPQQFDKYNLVEEDNASQELEDALNQSIDEVLDSPAFSKTVEKPEQGVNKLAYINSLANQKLIKAVMNKFNQVAKDVIDAKAKAKEIAEKLKEQSVEINKQQDEIADKPEDPKVGQIEFDTRLDTGEIGPLKRAADFFVSSSSSSDDPRFENFDKNPAPHIVRSRVFLNNAKNNKKRDKFRAITFTYNQEAQLGLTGVTELSYGANWATNKDKVNDLIDGFVAQVYVEVSGKNRYFIDQNGNRIKNAEGKDVEVGQPVDLGKVVFETRPTVKEYNSDKNKSDRFRTGEKEEFLKNMEIWKNQREMLFSMAAKDLPTSAFRISKGFGILTDKKDGKYVKNKVGDTIIDESKIETQPGLLKISTGTPIVHNGENMNAKPGMVYIQDEDTLQILNNNVLGNKKAKTVYEVIKSIITEMEAQALADKPVQIDRQKLLYLRSVLVYARPTKDANTNQLWIDVESMSVKIGTNSYAFNEFVNNESVVVKTFSETYHSANKKTLDKNEPYFEFVFDNGKMSFVKWANYQSYLLSGENRSVDDIPFVTNVSKVSEASPYNYRGKYSTLINFSVGEKNTNFKAPEIVEEKPPVVPPVEVKSELNSPSEVKENLPEMKLGDFTLNDGSSNDFEISKQVVKSQVNYDGTSFIIAIDFSEDTDIGKVNKKAFENLSSTITEDTLNKYRAAISALNENSSKEDTIIEFFKYQIQVKLGRALAAQQQAPPATTETSSQEPSVEAPAPKSNKGRFSGKSGYKETRAVSKGEVFAEKTSDADIEIFKTWQKKNVPNIPFEILDKLITVNKTQKAWGVFENGVAKFFKRGLRGTEYHEIFEGIWMGFLSQNEREAILGEFKDKPGYFLDRESGQQIAFNEATDRQAKERIADDFADFRLGKISAKTLSQKIRNFFNSIIEFFKSFVQKPSLKDQLFEQIEAGRFKESVLPDYIKTAQPEYRNVMVLPDGGILSEDEAFNIVQDMTLSVSGYLLNRQNDDTVNKIFDLEGVSGTEVYNYVRDVYSEINPGESTSMIDDLGETLFNELFLRNVDNLRTVGVNINAESLVSVNDENGNNRLYSAEAFEIDFKKNAKFAPKYIIATLPASDSKLKDAVTGLPLLKTGAVGLPILSNFNRTFATLLSKLSNTSLSKIPQKLLELYKEDGNYYRAVRALNGNMSAEEAGELFDFDKFTNDDWRLYIQFVQAFNKSKPDAVVESRSVTPEGVNVISKPAEKASVVNVEKYNWLSNLKLLATEGGSMIKQTKLSYSIDVNHPNYPKTLPSTNAERITFLRNIGINFPATAISNQNKFVEAVNAIYTYGSKDIATVEKFTGADSSVGKLAIMYVDSINPDQDTTRLNVENKSTGNYSDSNSVSVFEEDFNESQTIEELLKKRPELRDVFSRNSLFVKKDGLFFDKNGNKRQGKILKIGVVDGISEDDGGTTVGSLTEGDRFSVEINQNVNGNYYILVPADSSTERTFNIGNQIKFENVNTEIGDVDFLSIMQSYLEDEIDLAIDWRNREKLAAVGETRAKQLRFFRDMLSPELVAEIENVIADKRISKKTARTRIDAIIDANKSEIELSLRDAVEYQNEKLRNVLKSTGEVLPSGEGLVQFEYLDTDFATKNKIDKNAISESDYNKLLSFLNMNQMIANIELHKFIFGDPYQFETKNGNLEETKRIKSWLSPRRKTFDSVEANTFLNREYNKVSDGTVLGGKDITRHNFNSSTKTVTLTDPAPQSKYIKSFGGYKESDGFSLMQIGTFREVKWKNGEWPKEAEAWYQWQMAYTRQKLSTIKKADGEFVYEYGKKGNALKNHDEALIKTSEPKYILEVLKPIVSGAKPNMDRIEATIDKFSQMPLFFKAVEGTHLQDLYTQMLIDNVGYVVYKSGRKEGTRSTHNLYQANGTFNSLNFGKDSIEEVAWSTYGIQQENSYEEGKNQTRGSQLMKNAFLDMFKNGVATMPGAQELYDDIMDIHDQYHMFQYEKFLNDLGIEDLGTSYKIADAKKVSQNLEYELLRRDASENVIDSIRLDENGQFRIPFEASSAYEEIRSVLFSMINKSLISPPMNGKSHVQTPVTLWENRKKGREILRKIGDKYESITKEQYEALSEADKKSVVLSSDTLKFYEDVDGKRYMEVMIPNYWKKYFKGMSDEEVLKYLNKPENQKILFGVGFRIPHQSASSSEVFKIAGFLHPSMGATVVVPSEIVDKAGSDFDIDKLNMYLKSVYVDANGNVKLVEYKGSKDATLKYYSELYIKIIQDRLKKVYKDIAFKSTLVEVFEKLDQIPEDVDLSTEELEKVLDKRLMDFYLNNERLIENIQEEAFDEDMNPITYVENQVEKFEKASDDLQERMSDEKRNIYAGKMYKKSLENRYFELLQETIALPENFDRLMSPVGDAELPAVAAELDKARQDTEAAFKNKLLSKTFLTSLRHAFVMGKKWVGIAAVNITGHAISQKINAYLDPARIANISEYDAGFLGDMSLAIPHNTVDVNGEKMISLGGTTVVYSKKDKKGKDVFQFISDRLSGYATAFVDVAKNPYIMKILRSDLVVGTAMFMERIGSGELTPYFLNQPIIIDYLKYLDRIGSRALFSDNNISEILTKYPIESGKSYDLKQDFIINPSTGLIDFDASKSNLLSSIDINAEKDSEFYLKQRAVFDEFLKLAKMAQFSFKFSQAYNYDTTRVRSTEGVLRKALRTQTAEDANIISSVNDVFDQTFIGKQRDMILNEVRALSSMFKLDSDVFYDVIDEVIKPYANNEYMSLDDFDRIVKKIKTAMIDYLVQNKSGLFSKEVINELLTGKNNIAVQLSKLQKKYPTSEMLSSLEPRFSKNEEGAVTVTLKVKPTDAPTVNRYIGFMRELKAVEPKFYRNLVLVGLLQGTYDTRVTFNKIVPLEDRADIITPLINSKYSVNDIENFSKDGVFFRTNFSDDKIVPYYKPKYSIFDGGIGYGKTGFILLKDIPGQKVTPGNGRVIRLSKKYENFNHSNMDFIKVKRYEYVKGRIIDITGENNPMSLDDFKARVLNGEISKSELVGYKKVKDVNGLELEDDNNNVYFKMVNLYGDGDIAKIYKIDGLPSSLPNNTYAVKSELSDDIIIKAINNEKITAPEVVKETIVEAPVPEVVAPTEQIVPETNAFKSTAIGDYTIYDYGDGTFDVNHVEDGIIADNRRSFDAALKAIEFDKQSRTEIEEIEFTTIKPYKYFGRFYRIVIDQNGKAIDVENYKGKKDAKQKLLNAYTVNPNVDPQNNKPFSEEDEIFEEKVTEIVGGSSFKFEDGTIVNTGNIILNDQQKEALQLAVNAIKRGQTKFVLRGYAGTGKSTISKFIREYLQQSKSFKDVTYSSPTHKANTNLLIQLIRGKIFNTLPSTTASLLNKIKGEDGEFITGPKDKMPWNGVLIVDESSMIDMQDYNLLVGLAKRKGTSIVFMGDPAQLPPVGSSQLSKALQFTSSDEGVELTQVMRQQGDNPLLDILTNIRQNLSSTIDRFSFKSNVNGKGEGVEFTKNYDQFNDKVKEYFSSSEYKEDPTYAKVLTYTNASVANYNNVIQAQLGLAPYSEGSIMMGYEQVGQIPNVHNGQDYKILKSDYVTDRDVKVFEGNVGNKFFNINSKVSGYSVDMRRVFSKEDEKLLNETGQTALLKPISVFIINPNDDRNIEFMERVLAFKKVLNDKTIPWRFRQEPMSKFENFFNTYQMPADIINYKGKITTLPKLKQENSELFKVDRKTGKSPFEETSTSDRPMLNKNIDYGYAVTSHKGQGSTYQYVFVDYENMENPANDKMINDNGVKYANERQQLKYVGLSRASKVAFVYTRKADNEKLTSVQDVSSQLSYAPESEESFVPWFTESEISGESASGVKRFYESLNVDQKLSLGSFENILDEYNQLPTEISEQTFIEILTCRL